MCEKSVLPFDYSDVVIEEFKGESIENLNIDISRGSEAGDNFVGSLLKIKISSKRNESRSVSLMLKQLPSDTKSMEVLPIKELFGREADVYNIILPAFDTLQEAFNESDNFYHVKCYKASAEFILMEDMVEKGYKMYERFTFFDMDHLMLVLAKLAQLHSLSFAMKEHHPEIFEKLCERFTVMPIGDYLSSVMETGADKAISIVDDPITKDKIKKFSKNIVEKYYIYCGTEVSKPYNVICHGDSWINNILFKYEEGVPTDLRLIDWQASKYCSPVIDIAFMIFSSTDSSMRGEHYSKILDFYYNSLEKNLVKLNCSVNKCYPKNVFSDHVEKLLPYGLLKNMMFLPIIISEKGDDKQIVEMNDAPLGKRCKETMIGIINDFVKLNLI